MPSSRKPGAPTEAPQLAAVNCDGLLIGDPRAASFGLTHVAPSLSWQAPQGVSLYLSMISSAISMVFLEVGNRRAWPENPPPGEFGNVQLLAPFEGRAAASASPRKGEAHLSYRFFFDFDFHGGGFPRQKGCCYTYV